MMMRRTARRIVVVAIAAAAFALLAARRAQAEEPDLASPGTRDITLKVGEDERTLRLHIPPPKTDEQADTRPAQALPLVIAIHGMGSSGKQMEGMTGFSPLADKKGFVVAYPDGENHLWRTWKVGGGRKDFDFIAAIMDALVKAGTVDARRIYATGISNGAYMSNALAVEFGDRIAAIAPVAGTFLKLAADRLKPPRPMPVCYFHGTEDPIVGYDGTDRFSRRDASMSAEDLCAWWAAKNGCENEAKVEKLDDRDAGDGTTVEKRTWSGAAPVVFYRVEGGGHTWPGMPAVGEKILGKVCKDVKASEIIWDFFAKYSLHEKKPDPQK